MYCAVGEYGELVEIVHQIEGEIYINSMLLSLSWDGHGELLQDDRTWIAGASVSGDSACSLAKAMSRRGEKVLVFMSCSEHHETLA